MTVRAALFGAVAVAAATVFAAPVSLNAHHGWGSYDATNPVTLTGKVVSSTHEFPHGTLVLAVDGRNWDVVLSPPSRLEARGGDRKMIAPGTELTAYGYKSTVHQGEVRAEWIEVAGKRIQLR